MGRNGGGAGMNPSDIMRLRKPAVAGPFQPSDLWAAHPGAYGFAYDFTDLTKMWQLITRATAATVGSVVGAIDDISGNGRNMAAAANDTTRPTLVALGQLGFDGTNDILFSTSPGMWLAAKAGTMTIIARLVLAINAGSKNWIAEGSTTGSGLYYPAANSVAS